MFNKQRDSTMHPFRAYIALHTDISEEDWQIIMPYLKHRIFQQNRVILKPGAICNELYFLENGKVSFYTEMTSEKEIFQSIGPPQIFTSANSFINRIPSNVGFLAAEESYVWIMPRQNVYELMDLPCWSNFIAAFSS